LSDHPVYGHMVLVFNAIDQLHIGLTYLALILGQLRQLNTV